MKFERIGMEVGVLSTYVWIYCYNVQSENKWVNTKRLRKNERVKVRHLFDFLSDGIINKSIENIMRFSVEFVTVEFLLKELDW